MAKAARTTTKRTRRRKTANDRMAYGRDKTYATSIHKLLKCVNPDLSINIVAMNVMNSFVEDLLERISDEASKLVHHAKRRTMGPNDIISATKLVIKTPGLLKYALEMAKRTIEYQINYRKL